jgi:hypothetical protein
VVAGAEVVVVSHDAAGVVVVGAGVVSTTGLVVVVGLSVTVVSTGVVSTVAGVVVSGGTVAAAVLGVAQSAARRADDAPDGPAGWLDAVVEALAFALALLLLFALALVLVVELV